MFMYSNVCILNPFSLTKHTHTHTLSHCTHLPACRLFFLCLLLHLFSSLLFFFFSSLFFSLSFLSSLLLLFSLFPSLLLLFFSLLSYSLSTFVLDVHSSTHSHPHTRTTHVLPNPSPILGRLHCEPTFHFIPFYRLSDPGSLSLLIDPFLIPALLFPFLPPQPGHPLSQQALPPPSLPSYFSPFCLLTLFFNISLVRFLSFESFSFFFTCQNKNSFFSSHSSSLGPYSVSFHFATITLTLHQTQQKKS